MGQAQFEHTQFLGAARALLIEAGPAAVTVGAVSQRLGAPTGSFYHRFASRDVLLGELWLSCVLDFQHGLHAAAAAGDWLGAALHTPAWCRAQLDQACVLLLHHRDDFVRGDWPQALRSRVAEQGRSAQALLRRGAAALFGRTDGDALARAAFVLAELPLAAVRPHLRRREPPPPLADELIRRCFDSIVTPAAPAGASDSLPAPPSARAASTGSATPATRRRRASK